MRLAAVAVLCAIPIAAPAAAQNVDGYVSLMGDVLPHVQRDASTEATVTELRARLLLERGFEIGDRLRITAAVFADGLVGDRDLGSTTTAGIVRAQELHLEAIWRHADLRVGMSRVAWGRLDEFQPTDVINPLDVTRFFLEGRSEARMAVAMVRGRWLPSDRATVEVVYVPFFRRGAFDQLAEPTSPFNLAMQFFARVPSSEPARTWSNAQGGARASVTTGRVDWSVSAYRGFESLPLYEITPTGLDERFPRFTMIGGDFETVRGEWGLRGEIAAFVDRTFQPVNGPGLADGRALEAGIGVDRRAGSFRVSGNAVLARRWSETAGIDRTDVTIVAAVDRSFSRATRTLRVFGVYNPGEQSAFGRVIASFSLRDNVAVEASAGLFSGNGSDALSLLASRDFAYTRLKVFF